MQDFYSKFEGHQLFPKVDGVDGVDGSDLFLCKISIANLRAINFSQIAAPTLLLLLPPDSSRLWLSFVGLKEGALTAILLGFFIKNIARQDM